MSGTLREVGGALGARRLEAHNITSPLRYRSPGPINLVGVAWYVVPPDPMQHTFPGARGPTTSEASSVTGLPARSTPAL